MSKLGHSLKHLVHEMIPPAAYFFVTFQLLALTHALMLKQYGIEATTFMAATIGALVAAKIVVLADLLPFINRFPGRPLIYNITWKTMIYMTAALAVRYAEELFHYYRHEGRVLGATRHLLDEVVWPHFWTIQIWLTVLLLVYCTLQELLRALGHDRVKELFFGPSGKTRQPQ
jgi:hypothetical protein